MNKIHKLYFLFSSFITMLPESYFQKSYGSFNRIPACFVSCIVVPSLLSIYVQVECHQPWTKSVAEIIVYLFYFTMSSITIIIYLRRKLYSIIYKSICKPLHASYMVHVRHQHM